MTSTSTSIKVFTVSELTQAIKAHLEPKFFHLCLKGEITNFTQQSSGHLYFNLKDEFSQISCVLFKNIATTLPRIPKAGDKVIIKGSLSLYIPRGQYQIVVNHLQHEGVGDLLLKLHELKEKLQRKGYFDPEKKKALPKYPKTIGVVTSPTGAVIHDILNVLHRRFKGFHLILNPVKVQGAGAEKEIAQAIHDFNRYQLADVLIIARGGGSLEDLWAFNEECVIEAIAASHIPIISSIGHETDVSLSDFAADVRAPTPSAAAEIVIKEKSLQLEFLAKAKKMLLYHLTQVIKENTLKLKGITKQKIFSSVDAFLGDYFQKMDDILFHLDKSMQERLRLSSLQLLSLTKQLSSARPDKKLENLKEKNHFFQKRVDQSMLHYLHLQKQKFLHLKELLESIDPRHLLKKGYCIPFAENQNSVIISSKQLKSGDSLSLQFYDGKVSAQVTKDHHG
jgi:exodeoxyribonuclease VII large subunit